MELYNYFLIFLGGLLSFGHCVGMCSIFPFSVSKSSPVTLRLMLYNAGRISAYIFLGFLVALFSINLQNSFSGLAIVFRVISFVVGFFILINGIGFLVGRKTYDYIPFLKPLYESIIYIINVLINSKNLLAPLVVGFLNGILPCPIVYNFLLVSLLSKSILESLLIMFSFGLGTFPAMFLMPYLVQKLPKEKLLFLYKALGIIIIYFGIFIIYRAFISGYTCKI